ncbi:MAG: CHAT domain-containing protein, partial [Myxococcales bacterium]|nr:CHAT domain-containing protein [Myxococcales bacterium]
GDGDDGDEAWIEVEAFAQEIEASMARELRLVVLEACSGARPGSMASAAETFARRGADTVVGYMWPVLADVARLATRTFYQALTDGGQLVGDVAASVQATRRALLTQRGAAAFAPVVFVRGISSAPFDFEGRRLKPPSRAQNLSSVLAADVDPALERLLDTPYSLVLDRGSSAAELAGLRRFRDSLERALKAAGEPEGVSLSLGTLTQRYALYAGHGRLSRLFQKSLSIEHELPIRPIVDALGATLRPGVHVTLQWLPVLEHAILRHHSDRTIYVVQTGYPNSGEKRVLLSRAPGRDHWDELERVPDQIDLSRDYVVLRLYGGYSPEEMPILTSPQVTEDDHIQGLFNLRYIIPPEWENLIMGSLRTRPVLCLGVSAMDWRHRMLLRWLFDQRPPPSGSLAILSATQQEQEIWEKRGAGLPGGSRFAVVQETTDALVEALRGVAP